MVIASLLTGSWMPTVVGPMNPLPHHLTNSLLQNAGACLGMFLVSFRLETDKRKRIARKQQLKTRALVNLMTYCP